MFFACSLLYRCSRTCFRTLCVCFRTYLRTFIASIMNGGVSLRTSNGCRSFQKIFQIHIIYNTRMNFVINSSKDWPINQILAYLWSFLSISAFVSINFCNFAVKQQKSIMAKLNRIRVVLAERDLNNKWLSDKLGKDPATVSKWVTNTTQPSLEALIAIANALEVPVQELVRQEEFNQEK